MYLDIYQGLTSCEIYRIWVSSSFIWVYDVDTSAYNANRAMLPFNDEMQRATLGAWIQGEPFARFDYSEESVWVVIRSDKRTK